VLDHESTTAAACFLPETRIRASQLSVPNGVWSESILTRSPHQRWAEACTTTAAGSPGYTQTDALAVLHPEVSPFAYVLDNPLNGIDPAGLIRLRRIEIKNPLGWSPNGGGLTIAHGLKIAWTCEKEGTCPKWKLEFTATEVYEEWAINARKMAHEDIHVAIDWAHNLTSLSRLLPAEHQRYSSATECYLAALGALAQMAQHSFDPDPRQFWHDVGDFFRDWSFN
jgi:hypothetical protein